MHGNQLSMCLRLFPCGKVTLLLEQPMQSSQKASSSQVIEGNQPCVHVPSSQPVLPAPSPTTQVPPLLQLPMQPVQALPSSPQVLLSAQMPPTPTAFNIQGQVVPIATMQPTLPVELWPNNFIILSTMIAVGLGILNIFTLPLTVPAIVVGVFVSNILLMSCTQRPRP